MQLPLFADTLLNIAVTGNLVRLEFGTLAPSPGPDGQQELRPTSTRQLVMPLEGFVRAFGMQERIVRKLVSDGVLKAPSPVDERPGIRTGTTTG